MCKNNFEIYDIQQLFSSVTEFPPQKQVNQSKDSSEWQTTNSLGKWMGGVSWDRSRGRKSDSSRDLI